MPLYEYRCPDCGVFQERRSAGMSSSPLTCPTCSGPVRRVFSPPATVRTAASLAKLRGLEDKSRDEPEIARRPSPTQPARLPADGSRQARLPKW